ncbi:zf-HC2 domain-containing protein [Paenibacillus sp. LS1]|uniref:zf-HC2 domain-containing protein n=1 Tax=Paenibacillus sp. LS1 TaxID=2992120 RepID=UPI002231E6C2|nr:zf-HC2 domain-containing protein [Paenibacillus sp. LS1]MCW3791377.1 zf-HC2 domain-containing protein [Paenibacillus sp. LS1]
MKCEEVVEWMHRYLDHDLGEAETAQMLQHVAKCPECAENFSLLRALSRELEELPQVSPKFSLVDAIMPQLDAIDEARREQSSTIQEMNPVPAAFENLQRSSERKTKQKQKWLNSMAGRMSMGAAAAAVVLGFAIWGYEPEQIENADSMMLSSGATQESGNVDQNALSKNIENYDPSTSSQPSSNDVFVSESNASSTEGDNLGSETMPEENGGGQVQEPGVQKDPTPQQPATESTPAPNKGTQDPSSSTPSTDHQKSPVQNQDAEQRNQESGSASTSSADGEENGTTEPENGDAKSFTSEDTAPNTNEDAPVEGAAAPDSGTGADTFGGNKGLAGPDQGMATTAAPKEWKSPDGSYVVMLLGDQISIYSKPANEPDVLNLVEQRNIEGTLKSASWSKDGTLFNYETDKDGTTAKNSFNVTSVSGGASAK